MNLEQLSAAVATVRNPQTCKLLAEKITIRIEDRERTLNLLTQKKSTSWDTLTDLMLEIDKLKGLLQRTEDKVCTLY